MFSMKTGFAFLQVVLFVFGQFDAFYVIGDEYTVRFQGDGFIGQAVDADKRGDILP
jgi:hypothetical protein